ncbi:MAG: penicillin acylase family protein [Candidatus Abyssobacteria bacterium SURF_5]|uniref:Penicillin acylase family protein n=1 Tax=Abyssobacteria bacterium (strain SURF_5) TaxID=2093360 RepID=A0A3A4P1R0_ABYX5|nr:MAG: penicillin acylase family protein [Candidatus Abyssubacteria bacterium SURF_5]
MKVNMKKRNIIGGILFLLMVAGLILVGIVRIQLGRSLPEVSGKINVKGLSAQVDVYRDEYGIPHIYAENRRDLMFAVGYVTAQDRLWQMDLTRRAATGRLAEILGETVLRTDLLMRTIGLERTARRQWEQLSPESAAMLSAFSDGVNAYLEKASSLPPEFRLLKYTPEPWQPPDSLAISRLLGWQLSKNHESEIVMMRIAAQVGADRAADLSPVYPATGPFILDAGTVERMMQTSLLGGSRVLGGIIGTCGGSNSWVLAPSRTTSGAAILANDPHLSGTRMPSIWYYVHLMGGGLDVIGALVPGTPLPLLGHNRHIGWGITNMNADVQDIFIERVNPDDPNQYEFDGAWVDMDTTRERIPFRADEGELLYIEKEIRRTIHGPVMNDAIPKAMNVVSLSWTGFEPTPDFEALLGINTAQNWNEFRQALQHFGVAPQNFIYADTDGNIGYSGAGLIPIRPDGNGVFPRDGWKSATAWQGWIPFEELPHEFNPARGYLVTANNRVVGDDYPHFLSAEWAPNFRSRRITDLIDEKERHDVEDIARMQMDDTSLLAQLICNRIEPALLTLQQQNLREAARLLTVWDGKNSTDSPASLLYHEFLLRFALNTFSDEFGKSLASDYLSQYYLWLERFVELMNEDSRWFDNVKTGPVETRDEIIILSFKQAVNALEEKYGKNMFDWRWDSAHTVQFRHPLDKSSIAKRLFNLGPFPFPGDGETINRGTFEFNEPYVVSMAASIRHIMDFSGLHTTLGIHTTGQSGHPLNAHYDDYAGRWLRGEYIPLMMNKQDFIGGVEGHLQLMPNSR